MTISSRQKPSFRCPVQPEQGKGKLHIGWRKIPVSVVEASLESYTVAVDLKHAKDLRFGVPITLNTNPTKTEVLVEWFFHSDNDRIQLGLRRLEDVTPEPTVKGSLPFFQRLSNPAESSMSGFLVGGLILFIVAVLALPGVGDDLGTAPRVRSVLKTVFNELGLSVNQFWN